MAASELEKLKISVAVENTFVQQPHLVSTRYTHLISRRRCLSYSISCISACEQSEFCLCDKTHKAESSEC